jgi:hypothetical protein
LKIKKLQKLFLTSTVEGAWARVGLPAFAIYQPAKKVAEKRYFNFASFSR